MCLVLLVLEIAMRNKHTDANILNRKDLTVNISTHPFRSLRGRFATSAFSATLFVAALLAGQAQALVLFDQNITPDVLYGSGNANGGWTVQTDNNVELGIRTHVRMPTPLNVFNSNGDGTYSYASGVISGKSLWNYDFSFNLNQDGSSNPGRDFNNTRITLGVDTDGGAGQSFFFVDPTTNWTDNAYGDNSTGNGNGDDTAATNAVLGGGLYVLQNSQNFAWTGLDPTLGPATWDFTLQAWDDSGGAPALLSQVGMSVLIDGGAQIPEPSTFLLLSAGLLGFAWRRKKQPRRVRS